MANCCNFLVVLFCIAHGFHLSLQALEIDPTLLKPDTHEAIIDEKDDTQPAKKSGPSTRDNEVSFKYVNYRVANRAENKVSSAVNTKNIAAPSATVAASQNKQNPLQDVLADNTKKTDVGTTAQSVHNNAANSATNFNAVFNSLASSGTAANPMYNNAANAGTTANSIYNNAANGGTTASAMYNKAVSNEQSKAVENAQNNALNNLKTNTQNGAGFQRRVDSNNSVEKALAFYESILANAKKNAKDNRGMKAEMQEEKQKNYADGIEDDGSTNVCSSEECVTVGKYIKEAMNQSADPCEDFYTFACGGWKKRNDIPESENEITAFTKLTKKIENATHTLLTAPAQADESEALVKARKFFYSCMNTSRIEADGPKPALDFIKSIGGWSMCGNKDWGSKPWDIYDVLKNVQSKYYPAPPFFTVEVTNDHLNSTRHLIKIDQSGLSLQREIYVKHPEIVEDYENYMVQIVKLLGYNCANVTDEVKEIIEFENMLAKVTTPAEAKQAGTFRRINVSILSKVVPQFPWYNHLKHIFQSEAKIKKAEVILATSPIYLYQIADKIKATPKRVLSKYVVWQMLRDKISLLSRDFRKARAAFNEKMTGVKDKDPRWRTCTGVTNDNMGVPIGTLYVQNYFKETTREKTQEMIKEIIKAFQERIKKHSWIDKKTRKGILEKTVALVAKVGYATYILQPNELNKRFKKLDIGSSFFVNNLNVDKWIRTRLFGKLRKSVDKTKWPMFPQTINAMYQFYENEIVIPAGILQAPFYYEGDVPRSLSYGAIGSIIGHELTHGFDNTGRKFDKNGDIVKEWWSASALKEFNTRAGCIRDQYSRYKVQDKYRVKGKLTLGENIADNGGTKLSYDAYMDWLKINVGPEPVLPGLKFTNKQLFFIGYAQEYCANVRQKTEYIATLSEIHAPSKFRVIGTLSNFEAFSDAFQCKKNTPMNPPKKCEVW